MVCLDAHFDSGYKVGVMKDNQLCLASGNSCDSSRVFHHNRREAPLGVEMKKQCSVDGCERPIAGLGMCGSHYMRYRRHGSPHGGRQNHGDPKVFFEQVLKVETDDCVLWPYGRGGYKSRYGIMHVRCRKVYVHRAVLMVTAGPRPTDKHEAAHNCGNGLCCNPRHIRWATSSENKIDKIKHGTYGWKLDESDVISIYYLATKTDMSVREIAIEFGINRTTVHDIKTKASWAALTRTIGV